VFKQKTAISSITLKRLDGSRLASLNCRHKSKSMAVRCTSNLTYRPTYHSNSPLNPKYHHNWAPTLKTLTLKIACLQERHKRTILSSFNNKASLYWRVCFRLQVILRQNIKLIPRQIFSPALAEIPLKVSIFKHISAMLVPDRKINLTNWDKTKINQLLKRGIFLWQITLRFLNKSKVLKRGILLWQITLRFLNKSQVLKGSILLWQIALRFLNKSQVLKGSILLWQIALRFLNKS